MWFIYIFYQGIHSMMWRAGIMNSWLILAIKDHLCLISSDGRLSLQQRINRIQAGLESNVKTIIQPNRIWGQFSLKKGDCGIAIEYRSGISDAFKKQTNVNFRSSSIFCNWPNSQDQEYVCVSPGEYTSRWKSSGYQ